MYTELQKDQWKVLLQCEDDIFKLNKRICSIIQEIDEQHNKGICNHAHLDEELHQITKDKKSLYFIIESARVYLPFNENEYSYHLN